MTSPVAQTGIRIDARAALAYVHRCAAVVRRHAPSLTRLDAILGDGDHGDNLLIGFAAVEEALGSDPPTSVGGVLSSVGSALVASVGGASGPLYGAAFLEAGFAARSMNELRTQDLATILRAAADGLARRGRCRVGDKTIYDALAPAADAIEAAAAEGAPPAVAVRRAVLAAHRGMRSTRPLVARRGLAMRLGERSRGHLDPGAASCFLLLRALAARHAGSDR
ncbi:MAG TPA: dihydroxyacetone kinase subunit DhaL [Candidatus Limnocylindria bacterium]